MHNFQVDELIKEAGKISLKSRVIIYNPNDKKIILCNYGGIYLLPGGKIDSGENPLEAVKRETEEETGLVFNEESFIYGFMTSSAQRNYIGRDTRKTTKALVEFVFFVDYSCLVDNKENILTEKEKNDNYSYSWVTIDEAINLIENNNTTNPRTSLYEGPLLAILFEIKDFLAPNLNKDIIFINKVTINTVMKEYKQDILTLYGDSNIIKKIKKYR